LLFQRKIENTMMRFIVCLILLAGVQAASWNYKEQGPDAWPHKYQACAGHEQSPINIRTSRVEQDDDLAPFKLIGYDDKLRWNLTHNGHTVVATRIEALNKRVGVEGSDFEADAEYTLLQFHFHWGHNDYQGSEHQVNGKKFPLELHLVHQSKKDKSLSVLGFLFELSGQDNGALADLLDAVDQTRTADQFKIVPIRLDTLLPSEQSLNQYFRYAGSLTTPPCSEKVVWNLFSEPLKISSQQLASFRRNELKRNFREPQPTYSREVTSSFSTETAPRYASIGKDDNDDSDSDEDSRCSAVKSNSALFAPLLLSFLSLKCFYHLTF